MLKTKHFVSSLLVAFCTVNLSAHDIMLIPQISGSQVKLLARYGEPGAWGTASVNKVMDILVYQPDGKIVPLNKGLKQDGANFQVAPFELGSQTGLWIFSTAYDGGFTVKTSDDRTIASTKMDYPAAASSYHNLKFGKTLVANGAHKGYDRVLGHRLEIIPQVDPFKLKTGDKLPVLVLFDGKPLAGEEVESGDETVLLWPEVGDRPKTDAKGTAMATIHSGLNRIAVEIERPSRTPALVDKDGYATALIFTTQP